MGEKEGEFWTTNVAAYKSNPHQARTVDSVLSSEGVVWVVDCLLAFIVIAPNTIHINLVTCAMKHDL
jgi:hypothetical protein